MFHYMICNQPDKEIFERQCYALLKKLPDLNLKEDLQDVDDSQYRMYDFHGFAIKVSNDHYVGGVFVDAEIELEQFFK